MTDSFNKPPGTDRAIKRDAIALLIGFVLGMAILALLLTGCSDAPRPEPSETRIGEYEIRGHSYLGSRHMGLLHAEHCRCRGLAINNFDGGITNVNLLYQGEARTVK